MGRGQDCNDYDSFSDPNYISLVDNHLSIKLDYRYINFDCAKVLFGNDRGLFMIVHHVEWTLLRHNQFWPLQPKNLMCARYFLLGPQTTVGLQYGIYNLLYYLSYENNKEYANLASFVVHVAVHFGFNLTATKKVMWLRDFDQDLMYYINYNPFIEENYKHFTENKEFFRLVSRRDIRLFYNMGIYDASRSGNIVGELSRLLTRYYTKSQTHELAFVKGFILFKLKNRVLVDHYRLVKYIKAPPVSDTTKVQQQQQHQYQIVTPEPENNRLFLKFIVNGKELKYYPTDISHNDDAEVEANTKKYLKDKMKELL